MSMLFQAVSQYIKQVLPNKKLSDIEKFLGENEELQKILQEYFEVKFNPKIENREDKLKDFNLDEFKKCELSKIITSLFENIVRTNFYLKKEAISFKIETKNFKQLLAGLQPNFEIFVYHPDFMGVHLRMSKVSRGGLRWSEREDFREEIKSLMITQDGKNSIIVPAGAKGGFVILKKREEITKEVFHKFYSKFINNLLDLVDNRDGEKILSNPNIVSYDEVDTYFVVAADKGTAQMSDVANQISIDRNFWLGDAFASGGSNGYSHKDLGITAKGSFVSTERFFLEKNINFYKEPISVIGIGSMNGDVFGNGINLSSKFKLLGAISHREIFIDPNPNPEKSYNERVRLFNSGKGAWSNYDKNLISQGGGVFQKKDENIPVSNEMKKLFNISEEKISGNDLIKKMLTSKIDLLFNGGVGTYVKSAEETHEEVGDLGNVKVRVDAKDIQAFAVCEGGNLGFTQKARVEFAKKGGKINLDGIDNSAGVNISDHEVNIKILLSQIDLPQNEKNELLKNATDEVVELVLSSSYNQALGLSLDEMRAKNGVEEFEKVVEILENSLAQFKREYFAIPEKSNFQLTRPNLSFLFSYSKILVTEKLLNQKTVIQSKNASEYLIGYFPKSLHKFSTEILNHPLQNEILATLIADEIINSQGVQIINLSDDELFAKINKYVSETRKFSDFRELGDSCKYSQILGSLKI